MKLWTKAMDGLRENNDSLFHSIVIDLLPGRIIEWIFVVWLVLVLVGFLG